MTTREVQLLQKQRLQEENSVQAPSLLDHAYILGFHPCESPRTQNNAFNKTIATLNQLMQDLGFSP
jgi:hypothetical protein